MKFHLRVCVIVPVYTGELCDEIPSLETSKVAVPKVCNRKSYFTPCSFCSIVPYYFPFSVTISLGEKSYTNRISYSGLKRYHLNNISNCFIRTKSGDQEEMWNFLSLGVYQHEIRSVIRKLENLAVYEFELFSSNIFYVHRHDLPVNLHFNASHLALKS